MYITIKQADPILAGFSDWTSATEDEKTAALNSATQRIELIPFRNEPQHRPRYTDGKTTGSTELIPEQLKILVAYLAEWYRQNPDADLNPVLQDVRQSLSPALVDLPISIQSGLWSFTSAELLAGIDPAEFREREPHSDQALSIVQVGEEHLFNTLSLGPFPLQLGGNFLGLGGRR